MYRLAIELGIFGDKSTAKNDPNAIKLTKHQKTEAAVNLIGRIENYSDDIQKEIKHILSSYLYFEKSSVFYQDGRFLADPIEDGILSSIPAYSYFMGQKLKKTLKADLPALAASLGATIPSEYKTAKDMKNWLISKAETYGPVLFPYCLEVRPSAEIETQPLTIYKYLHRKFDESAIYDTIYDGTVDEDGYLAGVKYERDLPDDFATDLLNYFGTNPIKK